MRLTFLLAFIVLCAGCSPEAPTLSHPAELNIEATQIIASTPDTQDLERALQLVDEAILADERYTSARLTRIQILILLERFDAVADEAERLAAVDDSSQNHLYLCMAKELTEQDSRSGCFDSVAHRMKAEGQRPDRDANLLMALRFASDPDYTAHARQYIATQPAGPAREIAEFMFLETSKEELVRLFFAP